MTKEMYYEKLTKNVVTSGEYYFSFDKPDYSNLSKFYIYDKSEKNVFSSEYIIKDDLKIYIKIKSNTLVFKIDATKLDKVILIEEFIGFLQMTIEDFLYVLLNVQWVVEGIEPHT